MVQSCILAQDTLPRNGAKQSSELKNCLKRLVNMDNVINGLRLIPIQLELSRCSLGGRAVLFKYYAVNMGPINIPLAPLTHFDGIPVRLASVSELHFQKFFA